MTFVFKHPTKYKKEREENMETCRECGEDLKTTFDSISKCENKNCELYFKKESVDRINHLEKQISLDKQMNGEEVWVYQLDQ